MNKLNSKEFENMFKTYFKPLCHYAYGIIGDMEHSRDVVQQAFTKLWLKKESMDLSKSVKSYLYMSVRNGSINHLRNGKKFQSSVLDFEIYDSHKGENWSEPLELLGSELSDKVERILKHMPEKSRVVFEMSRFEKKKYKEIANVLGVTVKTVEAHMSRALKIFRSELKDYLVLFIVAFYLFKWLF